jgi:hypothetical protein
MHFRRWAHAHANNQGDADSNTHANIRRIVPAHLHSGSISLPCKVCKYDCARMRTLRELTRVATSVPLTCAYTHAQHCSIAAVQSRSLATTQLRSCSIARVCNYCTCAQVLCMLRDATDVTTDAPTTSGADDIRVHTHPTYLCLRVGIHMHMRVIMCVGKCSGIRARRIVLYGRKEPTFDSLRFGPKTLSGERIYNNGLNRIGLKDIYGVSLTVIFIKFCLLLSQDSF